MSKLFTALVGGGIILCTAASAQMPAAIDPSQRFQALLDEARSKVPSTSEVGTINTTLSTAEWYWRRGDQVHALSYLNFARGRLGLSLIPPIAAPGPRAGSPAGSP
ncbi:hypothetical protein [Azospirillum picis]|uniref:Uncharacterized protein n=1 Tax=Azospirillum picis TaxID=488438 RepID=A0ABU0MVD0_9PROT|nr:hypothetical protein [Azospirillum picis]MBP2303582.1 hypothetical protein [Azospirillum picis]MDQ0537430.1 hypothetical protein [Azospirillum picis]